MELDELIDHEQECGGHRERPLAIEPHHDECEYDEGPDPHHAQRGRMLGKLGLDRFLVARRDEQKETGDKENEVPEELILEQLALKVAIQVHHDVPEQGPQKNGLQRSVRRHEFARFVYMLFTF